MNFSKSCEKIPKIFEKSIAINFVIDYIITVERKRDKKELRVT